MTNLTNAERGADVRPAPEAFVHALRTVGWRDDEILAAADFIREAQGGERGEAMWGVEIGGELNLRTVSDTERAAKVNWLFIGAMQFIPDTMTDDAIEALWLRASKQYGATLVPLHIVRDRKE